MNKERRIQIVKVADNLSLQKADLSYLREKEEEYRDNLPENLSESDWYTQSDEKIDKLDEIIRILNDVISDLNEL